MTNGLCGLAWRSPSSGTAAHSVALEARHDLAESTAVRALSSCSCKACTGVSLRRRASGNFIRWSAHSTSPLARQRRASSRSRLVRVPISRSRSVLNACAVGCFATSARSALTRSRQATSIALRQRRPSATMKFTASVWIRRSSSARWPWAQVVSVSVDLDNAVRWSRALRAVRAWSNSLETPALWHGSGGPNSGLANQPTTASATTATTSQRPIRTGFRSGAGDVPDPAAYAELFACVAGGGGGFIRLRSCLGGCRFETLAGFATGTDTGGAEAGAGVSRAGSARLSSTGGAEPDLVALASGFSIPQPGQKRTFIGSSKWHSRQLSIRKEATGLFGLGAAKLQAGSFPRPWRAMTYRTYRRARPFCCQR